MIRDLAEYFEILAVMQTNGTACVQCGNDTGHAPSGKPRVCAECRAEARAELDTENFTRFECRVNEEK